MPEAFDIKSGAKPELSADKSKSLHQELYSVASPSIWFPVDAMDACPGRLPQSILEHKLTSVRISDKIVRIRTGSHYEIVKEELES